MSRDRILMCPPDYFTVDYVINPWMAGHKGSLKLERAEEQWQDLRDQIVEFADVVQPRGHSHHTAQYPIPAKLGTVINSHQLARNRSGCSTGGHGI